MGTFDGLRLGSSRGQGGQGMGTWLLKQFGANLVNQMFQSDLPERRFQFAQENDKSGETLSTMSDILNSSNNIDYNNPEYKNIIGNQSTMLDTAYNSYKEKYPNGSPLIENFYNTSKIHLQDENFTRDQYWDFKTDSKGISDRIRKLDDVSRTNPMSALDSDGLNLQRDIRQLSEDNIGQKNYQQNRTLIDGWYQDVKGMNTLASLMNNIDNETDKEGLQLSTELGNMRVTIGKDSKMYGHQVAAVAEQLLKDGHRDRAISYLEKLNLWDVSMDDLAKTEWDREVTRMQGTYGSGKDALGAAINNRIAGLQNGIKVDDKGFAEIDDWFGAAMMQMGTPVKDISKTDLHTYEQVVGTYGRNLYTMFYGADMGKGQGFNKGIATNLYGHEKVKSKLLGTNEKPGVLYTLMGFRHGDMEYNKQLANNPEMMKANMHKNIDNHADVDGNWVQSFDSTTHEESKKMADAALGYIDFQNRVDGLRTIQGQMSDKLLNGPPKIKTWIGDELLEQDAETNKNNIVAAVEDNNDLPANNNPAHTDLPKLSDKNNAALKVKLFQGIPIHGMAIADYALEDNGKYLVDGIGQHINNIVALREFEEESDIDEIVGQSYVKEGREEGIDPESLMAYRQAIQPEMKANTAKAKKELTDSKAYYEKIMNIYKEDDFWFPTWGPNVNTMADLKVGDKGYHGAVVEAASRYRDARINRSPKVHNKDWTLGGQKYGKLRELEQSVGRARHEGQTLGHALGGEVRPHKDLSKYIALREAYDHTEEVYNAIVTDEGDRNEIMIGILDNNTEGNFSYQNGLIKMPDSDSMFEGGAIFDGEGDDNWMVDFDVPTQQEHDLGFDRYDISSGEIFSEGSLLGQLSEDEAKELNSKGLW